MILVLQSKDMTAFGKTYPEALNALRNNNFASVIASEKARELYYDCDFVLLTLQSGNSMMIKHPKWSVVGQVDRWENVGKTLYEL